MSAEALGSGVGMPFGDGVAIDPTGKGVADPGLTRVLGAAPTTVSPATTLSQEGVSWFQRFGNYLADRPGITRTLGGAVLIAGGLLALAKNATSDPNEKPGASVIGVHTIQHIDACPDGVLKQEDTYAASRPGVLRDPSDAWVAPKTNDDTVMKSEFLDYLFNNAGNTLSPGCDTATYIGALHFIASKRGETNSLGAGSFAPIGNADETIRHFAENKDTAKDAAKDVAEWHARALLINKETYEKVTLYRVIGIQNPDGSVTIGQVPANIQTIQPGTFAIIGVPKGDAFAEEKDKTSLFVGYDLKTGQLLIGDGFGLPQPQSSGEQTVDITGGAGNNSANTAGTQNNTRGGRGKKPGQGQGDTNTGGAAGPNGNNPEAGPGGQSPSPVTGGTPGTTPGTPGTPPAPTPEITTTTTTRPNTSTTVATTTTTIPRTTTTVPQTTTTSTTSTTSTPPTTKGTVPCDPNIAKC